MLKELSLQSVQIRFPGASTPTLRDVSLRVRPGEFLAVVGPSGCGKSTLLRAIAGLLFPAAGTILTRATSDSAEHDVRFGFVFQHPTLLPWRTAAGNLALPAELGERNTIAAKSNRAQIAAALQQVGLTTEDADKRPAQMSGGMQMRLSLARALMLNPDVLLLDEPFAAVDDLLRLQLQEDVSQVHDSRGLTSVLVTHNLHEAVFMSDRVVVLGGLPATVIAEFQVGTERPRHAAHRATEGYHHHVEQLTRLVFGQLNRDLQERVTPSPANPVRHDAIDQESDGRATSPFAEEAGL